MAARFLRKSHPVSAGAELWSAAACCRFPPRELARGDFKREHNSRQQAGSEQRVAHTLPFMYAPPVFSIDNRQSTINNHR
jgi:hypothetical protein